MRTNRFNKTVKTQSDLITQLNKLCDECDDMMGHLYERKIDSGGANSFMIYLSKWVTTMEQGPSVMPQSVAVVMYKKLRCIHRQMKKDLNVE